jgi:hypothetical protein
LHSTKTANKRVASTLQWAARHLCGGASEVLIETLLKFDEWTIAVLRNGLDSTLAGIPRSEGVTEAPDLIHTIAQWLTNAATGMQERDLLCKSIQESLFYTTGTDPQLSRAEFEARLIGFLHRRGGAQLLRRFLSLHIFNVIWSQAGEAIRAGAASNDEFVTDMQDLERACRRIVQSTFRKVPYPLTPTSAERLITEIQSKLETN